MTVSTARTVLEAQAAPTAVSGRHGRATSCDEIGPGGRSRIGIMPTTNRLTAVRRRRSAARSAMGKRKSTSLVLEFRR